MVAFATTLRSALITGTIIALPLTSGAQTPPDAPKLMLCVGVGVACTPTGGPWVEMPPGSVIPLPAYVGGRTDGIHPPANPDLYEGWGWGLSPAPPQGGGAFLFYAPVPPPDEPNPFFHWFPSDALPSPVEFFSGPWIAGFPIPCSPSASHTLKFFYTPPYDPFPSNPPNPVEIGSIPFTTTESTCYAPATTHPDPSNRPPSNGPEAGQIPDVGEEPDPELPCSAVGQPVEVTTGNVFFDHTDLVLPTGGAPLRFTRSYNSKNAATGGMFGPGWTFSYERALTFPAPGKILLHEGRGTASEFGDANGDGTFEPRRRAKHVNTIAPGVFGTWTRTYARGGYEVFDKYGFLTHVYDASGQQTLIGRYRDLIHGISTNGGAINIEMFANGRPKQLAAGGVVVARYDYYEGPDALLKTVTYPDGSGYRYTYHAATRELWQVFDLEGQVIETHTYEGGKAVTSEIADGKEKFEFEYEPGRTTVTDALGRETTYDWSAIGDRNLVTKIAGPCGACGGGQQSQEWLYDPATGAVLTYKDGRGKETSYTYYPDTKKLETVTRRPEPGTPYVTRFTYHPDGRIHQRFDANGGILTLTHGPAGPLEITQKVTASQTRTTSIEYYGARPWKITDPRSKVTELTYAWATTGWLESITDPLANTTRFEYDTLGRRTRVVLPPTTPPTQEPMVYYDTPGRIRFVVDPGGTAGNPDDSTATCTKCTLYKYDKGGRLILRKDANGREIRYGYDDYGRLEDIRQPVVIEGVGTEYVTRFTYDDASNLQTVEDPRGKVTDFDYDALDRLWRITYPPVAGEAARVEEYTYHPNGLLWTRKDRKGVTTTFEYDDIGRLKRKTYSDGSPAVDYGYDATGLTSASNGTSSLSWTYDLAGQLRTATDSQGTIVYDYELTGQRKSLNFNTGAFVLTYEHDDAGRLRYIRRGTSQFEFVLDDASRRKELRYPNGTTTEYTPDLLSRLQRIELKAGQATLNAIDYSYDDVWNVASKTSQGIVEGYQYDDAYRLTQVDRNGAPAERYTYDAAGNRKTPPRPWEYNDRNELVSFREGTDVTRFSYDLNGNRTRKAPAPGGFGAVWDYEWDVENRLTRVLRDQAEVARFTYDSLGRRSSKIVGEVTTQYTYDGMDILRETRSGSAEYFVHGPRVDEPLAQEADGSLTYHHADALGSIVASSSSTGAIFAEYSYSAYGNLGPTQPTGYAYTGREWDPETGLYYYRARYYDPGLGRFVSTDPIGLAGGINFYTYVKARPTNLVDPFGLVQIALDPNSGMGRNLAEMGPLERALLPADVIMPMSTIAKVGAGGASVTYRGSKLARNMCAAGQPVTKGAEEAHHIIARLSKKAAEARQVLIELGLDIDAASNGVALPRNVHRGLHTDAYYFMVNVAAREWKTANDAVEGLLLIAKKLVE